MSGGRAFRTGAEKYFRGQNAQAAGVDANIDLVIEAPAFPMTAITHCEKGRNADAGARLAPIPFGGNSLTARGGVYSMHGRCER